MVGSAGLDADAYVSLLTKVGDELRSQGISTEIYIFGGAAMALGGYFSDRRSDDLDVQIKSNNAEVIGAANRVARDVGLPSGWMNEAGTSALPRKLDLAQRTVFVHDNLVARVASPKFMLAMKMHAARGGDGLDALALCRRLGVHQTSALWDLFDSVYDDQEFSQRATQRTRAFVADLGRELHKQHLDNGGGMADR